MTKIGDFGAPAADAIAMSPQGKLYTVTQGWPTNGVNPQLASVDLATGLATPFGVNLNPRFSWGSASPRRHALRSECGQRILEPEQPLPVRSDHRRGHEDGASRAAAATSWTWLGIPTARCMGPLGDSLYRINRNTGQAELVTKLQGLTAVMGLAIDDHGNFYASEIVDHAPLWRVNPVTGAATAVAGVSLSFPHGLSSSARPCRSRSAPLKWKCAGTANPTSRIKCSIVRS